MFSSHAIKGFKRSFHKLTKVQANLACANPEMVYNMSAILKSKPFAVSLIHFLQVQDQISPNFLNYFLQVSLGEIGNVSGTSFALINPGGFINQYSSQTVLQRVFRVLS